MAKKTKARRSGRPRLSEAQLRAYRERRALMEAAPVEAAPEASAESAGVVETSWGRLDAEYAMIRSDLIRMIVIAAVVAAILVVLTFVLG